MSKKVRTVKIGDEKLSCGEIKGEFKRLDNAQANIDNWPQCAAFTGMNPWLCPEPFNVGFFIRLILAVAVCLHLQLTWLPWN